MKNYVDFSGRTSSFRHTTLCAVFFYGKKHFRGTMKKLKLQSEVVYLAAIVLLAFSVAMLTSVDFGISMIVAPAYILSLILPNLTFGQAEYVLQGILFVLFCIIMKKFRLSYLSSFVTCLLYGAVLDLFRLIPLFNPTITPPGSMDLWARIVMFVFGILMTSFSVALFFKTYLFPQVYDMFVKCVSHKYTLKRGVFKTCFDLFMLALGTTMTLAAFKKFVGINWGTLVMTLLNGTLISLFSKLLDKCVIVTPIFKSFASHFDLDEPMPKVKCSPYVREI